MYPGNRPARSGFGAIRNRFAAENRASARYAAPMRIPIVALLAALLPAIAPQSAAAQAPRNAADEYDRIARVLLEVDADRDGPWSDPDGASYTAFMQRGEIDARMQRWLDATRPLVADLVRATGLPYERPLDRSQGFALILPHYARQRTIVRSLDVLLVDAQHRNPATAADILRAQAAITERTASDGLLISSLVAIGCGSMPRARLEEMVNRGAIDASLAREVLAATASIDGMDVARLPEAVESEHAMLVLEVGRISGAEGDDRARRIDELAGMLQADPATRQQLESGFSDEALAAFPSQAEAYRAAARAVVEAPTREAALAAEAELAAAVKSGAYGELVRSFAPALERVVDRAWQYENDWAAVRADLAALADGSKTPEDLMDAAFHYLRASAAATQLGLPEQAEFDSLRRAGGLLDADIRSDGRTRLARVQRSITAEVYRGSRLGRLRFDERTLRVREVAVEAGLVRVTQPGIHGAVRTMLAAALTDDAPAHLAEAPVASASELCVAAVRVAAHYASTGQFGHALAALAMLQDAADAIDQLAAGGRFGADGKAGLAKALARLDAADPIGLERAAVGERTRLSTFFSDTARLARLSAVETATLVAAIVAPGRALDPADCACPEHGALLDMRRWFDAGAFARAKAANAHLEARREAPRAAGREQGIDAGDERIPGPPLAGIEVVPPFDIDRAREDARAAVERLRRLAE